MKIYIFIFLLIILLLLFLNLSNTINENLHKILLQNQHIGKI